MNKIKTQNWLKILILVAIIILGIVSVVTAIKLYQLRKQPVAPTAPAPAPAASDTCQLSFSVATPTVSPTPYHHECVEGAYISVPGAGSDLCQMDADCITPTPPQYKWKCEYNAVALSYQCVQAEDGTYGTLSTCQANCPPSVPSVPPLTPTPSITSPPIPTPTPKLGWARMYLLVKFQGVEVKRAKKTIKLTLKKAGTEVINNPFKDFAVKMTSNQRGVYSATVYSIWPSRYDLFIDGPAHLQRKFAGVKLNEGYANDIDLTSEPLLAGDIVDNEKVDIFDYNALVEDFGPRMPKKGSLADLDFDGDVDIFDYNLLVTNFGKKGEQ